MNNNIPHSLRSYLFSIILAAFLFTGCSWISPGSVEDPGEATDAPTEPEVIQEGYEEGSEFPEENF